LWGEIDVVDIEATRGRTRQGTQGLSEDPKARRTTRAKSVEEHSYTVLGWETTGVEGEDDDSEFEPAKTSQGRAKTLGAPAAKRVQKPPKTPVRGSGQNKGKPATTKDAAKDKETNGSTGLMKAFLSLIEELKASKAQQEAKDKVLTNGVAALQTEIAALRTEILTLQENNGALKKKLKEITKRLGPAWVNSRQGANPTLNNQDWPSLSSTQTLSNTSPTRPS
jgi:hypothetical protein